MQRKKRSAIPQKEAKCLALVYEVCQEGFDPSVSAVALLLKGDESVNRFHYLKTYGSLQSPSTRKLKSMVTLLLKKGYLTAYSLPGYEERYLMLTEEGEDLAKKTLSKNIRKSPLPAAAPLFNERN